MQDAKIATMTPPCISLNIDLAKRYIIKVLPLSEKYRGSYIGAGDTIGFSTRFPLFRTIIFLHRGQVDRGIKGQCSYAIRTFGSSINIS